MSSMNYVRAKTFIDDYTCYAQSLSFRRMYLSFSITLLSSFGI